ncbi:MAG: SUMF1/EgtB/PvdO family nonheme iron enzyme, partial [Planctomycetota bacterium]
MAESDVSSLPNLKSVKEYLWVKYVDFGSPGMEIEEDAATQLLEEHHRSTPISEDGENYYLGIVLFENAENHPKKRKEMLAGARHIFEAYRERTGEMDWDPIEDRLLDIADALDGLPEPEQKKLRDEAAQSYAFVREAAAAEEPETEETPGMVLVPSGPFLSGPTKSLKETNAFWMDTYPVTNEQFAAFCQETGYRHPKFWAEGRMREPRAPVVGVSWFDAYKYAAWAGKSLPTRDQWEKAARGKT